MAYIHMSGVEYDRGGRVRTLEGEVRYDDGGRVRTLLGHDAQLGQDEYENLPLTSSDNWTSILPPPMPFEGNFPIEGPGGLPTNWYQPDGPTSLDTFGNLAPPSPVAVMPSGFTVPLNSPLLNSAFQAPVTLLQTQSAPITGSLTPPGPARPALVVGTGGAQAATGIIASAGNLLRSIFGGSTVQAAGAPVAQTGGHFTAVGAALADTGRLTARSWFVDPAQEIVSGVPNWGVAAAATIAGVMLFSGGRKSTQYFKRKRNPAELILMGANPHSRRRR